MSRLRVSALKLITTALAVCLMSASAASGQESSSAAYDSEATAPKITYAPELEKKLSAFLDKVAEAKKKIWAEQIRKEVEEMVKVAGVSPDVAKALNTAGERSSDLCLPDWKKQMDASWRTNYAQQSEESMQQMLEQGLQQLEEYARYNWFEHVVPVDHPSWKEAVRQIVPAEQLTVWENESGKRKAALRKQIEDFLKPLATRTEEQVRQTYETMVGEVVRTLSLSKDLAKQLDALAASVAKTAAQSWTNRAERMLSNYDELQRRQTFKQGNIYMALDRKENVKLRAMWNKGVDSALPAEALERLKTIRAAQKARRTRAWSQLLIAELDRRVAFTSTQRDHLRPIVERLVASDAALTSENSDASDNGLPLTQLFVLGARAGDTEIKTILEPVQMKQWMETCGNKGNDSMTSRVIMRNFDAQEEDKQVLAPAEPEEIEGLLSDYLYQKVSAERSRTLKAMLLKADDASRITGITAEATDRLRLAARGAAEQSLTEWKAGLYDAVRPYANAGSVQMVTQRLANMQDYRLQRSVTTPPEQQTIWEEAVNATLTADQNKAWQAEIQQRNAYRDTAIAAAILEAFQRKVQASDTQVTKLEGMLAKILGEYGDDIRGMFSSSTGWYLQRYSMFLPFAGIPENEMKEILTKEQLEAWTGCGEFNNATNYWENIKRMHDQRTKARK